MGKGAKFSYHSNQKMIGDGSWEIVDSQPGKLIKYRLLGPTRGQEKTMTIKLERTGQNNKNVKITQEYRVNYGWDLIGRYAGMYASRNVGDDIKRGLDRLVSLLATVPKFDYSTHPNEFHFTDLPAQNVLLVTTAANRSNDEIALAMTNQVACCSRPAARTPRRCATSRCSACTPTRSTRRTWCRRSWRTSTFPPRA